MAIALVSPGSTPDPPYGQIKAKGMMFRLDYERINQSATWARAAPELKPWLLMMWYVAWQQTPCGSLDADEQVIAAQIGMPWAMWLHHRDILMRKWTRCSDGRVYHHVLSELVGSLDGWRAGLRERQALHRSKKRSEDEKSSQSNKQELATNVTRYSHVSNPLVREPEPEPKPLKSKTLSDSASDILAFLNLKTGRHYQPVKANIELIVSRLKEGATLQECKQVIAKKVREWSKDDRMKGYTRPKTLFNRTNFAQYVGELNATDPAELS